ncbi:UNVERIFIED_CONTAM: hypothetical protein K2H54_061197 [Gekko kuhli]
MVSKQLRCWPGHSEKGGAALHPRQCCLQAALAQEALKWVATVATVLARTTTAVAPAPQDARPQVATATKETRACPAPVAATMGGRRPAPAKEAQARPAVEKEVALGFPPPPTTDQLARAAAVNSRRACSQVVVDGERCWPTRNLRPATRFAAHPQ